MHFRGVSHRRCANGSVVEHRLAKARVGSSNLLSRFREKSEFSGFFVWNGLLFCKTCLTLLAYATEMLKPARRL